MQHQAPGMLVTRDAQRHGIAVIDDAVDGSRVAAYSATEAPCAHRRGSDSQQAWSAIVLVSAFFSGHEGQMSSSSSPKGMPDKPELLPRVGDVLGEIVPDGLCVGLISAMHPPAVCGFSGQDSTSRDQVPDVMQFGATDDDHNAVTVFADHRMAATVANVMEVAESEGVRVRVGTNVGLVDDPAQFDEVVDSKLEQIWELHSSACKNR